MCASRIKEQHDKKKGRLPASQSATKAARVQCNDLHLRPKAKTDALLYQTDDDIVGPLRTFASPRRDGEL